MINDYETIARNLGELECLKSLIRAKYFSDKPHYTDFFLLFLDVNFLYDYALLRLKESDKTYAELFALFAFGYIALNDLTPKDFLAMPFGQTYEWLAKQLWDIKETLGVAVHRDDFNITISYE